MHIVIFSLGSRGDVQPYLALALGLQQAGHRVTLVAPHSFAERIQSYGVGAHPARFDVQELMRRPEVRATLQGRNPVRQFRFMRDVMQNGAQQAMDDFWQAAQTADLVVQTGTGNGGVEAATQRGIPLVIASVLPFPPTRAFPSFFLPLRASLGGGYNRLTHTLMHRVLWAGLGGPATNRWRASRLGLPPWRSYTAMFAAARRLGTPWLFGYSPSVLPKPPDWEDYHHVTGYWRLDPPPGWQPPADFVRFLESGPPPVYVGFGSLSEADPERSTRLVLRALELSGQRGVLLTGWGGLARLAESPNLFYVDDVPHAWLFPRLGAVVHHGGAGTTGAGLRAGVPSIVTPFAGDQLAWADRVARLGVGPRAGPLKSLTAEKLAQAIQTAVTDQALRARAAALGEKIRAEDGVARAVEIIERHAAQFKQRFV
jgi:UDP:flavonoid glycosyltransferase YjiC (YdhE family)